MRKLLIFLILLFAAPLYAQVGGQQTPTLSNPYGGNITASSTNCSVAQSCAWQKLPSTATTTTITISGTFNETLIVETSADGGNTFTTSSTQTAPIVLTLTTTSLTDVRVRCSVFTSGSAGVNIQTAGNQQNVTISGGGITSVAVLPATCTPGVTAPVQLSVAPFGVYYCAGTNIWAPDGGSITPQVTFDATAYGVIPNNGQACFDGTVTAASAVVSSGGLCHFNCPNNTYPCSVAGSGSDVGKVYFVTQLCSTTGCAPYYYMTSTKLSGPTQVSSETIVSIQSATSFTGSANSSASCANPNTCAIVVLTDQTAAINAAWNAATASTVPGCPRIQFPAGIIGFSAGIFQNPASNQCATGAFKRIQQLAIIGPAVVGTGAMQTILVPLPNFNFASGCSNSYVGGSGAGFAMIDIGISGFGQSYAGAGLAPACGSLVTGEYFHNTNFTGWATRINGQVGLSIGAYSYASDNYWSGFGANGGNVAVTGGYVTLVNNTMGGYQALTINANAKPVGSSNNTFFGPSFANVPAIEVASGAILVSSGDSMQPLGPSGASAPTPSFQVDAGGTAYISGFTDTTNGANGNGLKINATGKAYVFGWNAPSAKSTNGLNNAGTYFDQCGNNFNGPITNTGIVAGSCSITGVAFACSNIALSANFGTSAACSAPLGNTQYVSLLITNGTAATGANPTMTYTFPSPFPANPLCSAWIQGGTQTSPPTFFTLGAVSTTSQVFTYPGTPTANLTEQVQIQCWVP